MKDLMVLKKRRKMQVINLLKLFFLINMLCIAQHVFADMPSWISSLPKTETNEMYYYRVTIGEGRTYDMAYANAFAKAILESSWKLGLEVKTSDDLEVIEKSVYDNITVETSRMNLPLNKVCEYRENLSGSANKRIYILWQVAKYGNMPPNFKEFTDCE